MKFIDLDTIICFYNFLHMYIVILSFFINLSSLFFIFYFFSKILHQDIITNLWLRFNITFHWRNSVTYFFSFEQKLKKMDADEIFFVILSFLKDIYNFLCEFLKK